MDVQGAHLIDGLIDAHKILLGAILRQQLRDIEAGPDLSNKVELAALDAHEKAGTQMGVGAIRQHQWPLGGADAVLNCVVFTLSS